MLPSPPDASVAIAVDRDLAQAVLAGRPGAFERLVRDYQRLCWHIIERMVRHPDDTRELCQEAFLRVHQCLHQYRGESALKSWIGQVAYSVAKRHLEKRRIAIVEPIADEEVRTLLHAAISRLPPLQRTVLTLYHLEEMPLGEIARVTGLPEGTLKSHLFRSRKRLREILETRLGATP